MSTGCCLTMPSNDHLLTSPSCLSDSHGNREEQMKEVEMEEEEEENYSIILNQHSPPMTRSNTAPISTRFCQQQPLLLVAEETENSRY